MTTRLQILQKKYTGLLEKKRKAQHDMAHVKNLMLKEIKRSEQEEKKVEEVQVGRRVLNRYNKEAGTAITRYELITMLPEEAISAIKTKASTTYQVPGKEITLVIEKGKITHITETHG